MGTVAYKGIIYGGGSDVEANPQDTATDDLEKVSIDGTVYDVTDADAVHTSDIGTANGVAELDANGLVPSSQLPSYVDDVLEYASLSAFPATGETGKIYVALDTNLTYRWSGSAYVEISPSLALGETSSTAYRGDRGKTAYDHATESGRSGAKSAGLYKIGVTAQGHVASTSAVAKADLTALGVADQNDVDAIEEDIEGYKTVTGKYITVTDAASLPAESYSLTLSPVQEGSGDPSPSNVRPIHGADEVGVRVRGKNFLQVQSNSGTFGQFTFTVNKDSDNNVVSITLNGTASETLYYQIMSGFVARQGIPYTLSGVPSGVSGIIIYNDNTGKMWRTSDTPTVTFDTETTMPIFIRVASGTTVSNVVLKPMIEIGSQATEFEPYKPTISTTITLPSTVYGGSVDMGGSGEVTKDSLIVDGSSDLSYYTEGTNTVRCYLANATYIKPNNTTEIKIVCDKLRCYAPDYTYNNDVMGISENKNRLSNGLWIRIEKSLLSEVSLNGMKAWLTSNPIQVVYEKRTADALSVTPFPQTLLEGVNNVWAEMKENSTVIDNAQQSLSYQPQNIVGQLRQEIEAKPDSFAQLSDVSFSNLTNGQIPKWNSTTNKWENANESGGGGSSSLADLSDTNISSPADGQILKWDGTSSKWVNANEYSYTLPTAAANTLGGIKVGDNLSIDNSGVLSSNIPAWTKLWNRNSGSSFVMPINKTELMLKLVDINGNYRFYIASAVHALPFQQNETVAVYWWYGDDGKLAYGYLMANGNTMFSNNTGQSIDFEIWVR